MCDQQRLRSACAYAQSDQSLCSSLEYSMTVKLLTEHLLEVQSLTGGYTGLSESTLVKMPYCWKSHVTAHIKEWDKLLLSNGVLHRKVTLNGQNFLQLVLPPAFREDVFEVLHDDLGHQGRDRTMLLIKQRFFWSGMETYNRTRLHHVSAASEGKLVQIEVSLSTLLLLNLM